MADTGKFDYAHKVETDVKGGATPGRGKRWIHLLSACFWLVIWIGAYVYSVSLFTTALNGRQGSYWGFEWLLLIGGSILLTATIAARDDTDGEYIEQNRQQRAGLLGFLKSTWEKYTTPLSQKVLTELVIGSFVAYGIFLVLDFFDLYKIRPDLLPNPSTGDEKYNLIRLFFSTPHWVLQPKYYLLVAVIPFAGMLLFWFWRGHAEANASGMVETAINNIRRHIVDYTDITVASENDCQRIAAEISKVKNEIEALTKEKAALASAASEANDTLEAATACLYFLSGSDVARDEAARLQEVNFGRPSALDLQARSVLELDKASSSSRELADAWAVEARLPTVSHEAGRRQIAEQAAALKSISPILAAVEVRLAAAIVQLEQLEGLMSHCQIRRDTTVRVPVWQVNTDRTERVTRAVAALGVAFIILVSVNPLLVAPPFPASAAPAHGIGPMSWIWRVAILMLAMTPALPMLRYVKLAFSDPPRSRRSTKWAEAALLFATGIVAFFGLAYFVLPDGHKAPEPHSHMEQVKLTCSPQEYSAAQTGENGKSLYQDWVYNESGPDKGPDKLVCATPPLDLVASKGPFTEDAQYTQLNFVMSVGMASQEGDRDKQFILAYHRAAALDGYVPSVAASAPSGGAPQPSWTGHRYLLVLGRHAQVIPVPVLDHALTADQRALAMMKGYSRGLDEMKPADQYSGFPGRYERAGNYLINDFFQNTPSEPSPGSLGVPRAKPIASIEKAHPAIFPTMVTVALAQLNVTLTTLDKPGPFDYACLYEGGELVYESAPKARDGRADPMAFKCPASGPESESKVATPNGQVPVRPGSQMQQATQLPQRSVQPSGADM